MTHKFKCFIFIRQLLFVVFFSLSVIIQAQEMLGVGLSNYSGSMSTLYNPAMLTNTKNFLDINIVSTDLFFRNNMYYLPASDYSLYKALRQQPLPAYTSDSINAKYYTNHDLKFLAASIRTMGPSAMFQYGNNGFALTTSARYFVSGNSIPWEFPVIAYKGIKNDSLHNINFIDYNINFSTAAWMEVGLSYAYNVFKYYNKQLTVGITLKKLWGYAGVYATSQNFNYILLNDSTINIKNMSAETGFSLPIDYNNNSFPNKGPFFRGSGLGMDIGVVYIKKKRGYQRWNGRELCTQPYEDYNYRIGVSILDIGNLKFKKNAQLHAYDNIIRYWKNYDTLNFRNVNNMMQSISKVFYGDPTASFKSSTMSIGLPTAISVQVDVHSLRNFYIAGFWIHPLRSNTHSLRRPAQLAVVPRYETKNFELSLPISIYDYKYTRVGISARFWYITVGTERLGTWLGMANINGLDIYTSIKFNLGVKGNCHYRSYNKCYNGEYGFTKKQRRAFRKRRR